MGCTHMRVGTKAPLPKKPRALKTCTRHLLREIVYDDSDEVDYTNRVPEIVRFQMKSDGLPPLLADSDEVGTRFV